jgi:polyribonucleotide nucleotidyltransferase
VYASWVLGGSTDHSKLDLMLAGTADAILMIEGFADFLNDDEIMMALEAGHAAVASACVAIDGWAAKVGKAKKLDTLQAPPEGLDTKLGELCGVELEEALRVQTKKV